MINYKNTLNLPYTLFPMRANLPVCEPTILERWYKDNLYEAIRHKKSKKKLFILHDGPPYVNGSIHLGHAVNKVLKDIILKYKTLMGYNAPYIPGWDCHGLPIELQVERLIGQLGINVDPNEFRSICRNYVLDQIEIQKKDFVRLGVLGDWSRPYLTMDFKTEANIIRTLSKVISNGYFYKGTKPVHWCFQCCSVLAESEVEYNNHCSTAIDVAFFAVDNTRISQIFNIDLCQRVIELVIWTTTPWTLPANQAISVHPDYSYQLIAVNNNKYIIIAANLVNVVMQRIQCFSWKILGETSGNALESLKFRHPFMSFDVPVVLSGHVALDSGTGVVHIAPNHGVDDYIVARKYNFKIVDIINETGHYVSNVHPMLDGVQVFQSNDIIINLLNQSGSLLHVNHNYKHNYPYCWRHAVPVIFRATAQWFLSMDKYNLRNKLLQTIHQVDWIPNKGEYSIETMIVNRPDWCLSRQRVWGVPIPLFIHKKTSILHPRTIELMEVIAQHVEQYGIQAWWDLKTEDIIGNEEADQYEKVLDTLDVWFDSGSTHYSVIPERLEYRKQSPDLYLEGSDQYRGWFMSSLIISTAITGKAPYREVLTHGFTVDAQGRKMSKSLGNVISPQEIIKDFGADILRLWIASSDYSKEMAISNAILKHTTDVYRRIRNTARFCLANISDFDPEQDSVHPENMIELDCWAMDRALSVQLEVISDYNKYNFHNVIQRIMQFCSVEMGSFYLDVIKDRQYTTKKNSKERRSCQTALYHILESMVRWIAPVLSFTADEIWRYIPGNRSKYVFTEEWYNGLFSISSKQIMNSEDWNTFLNVRNEVNKIVEQTRLNGIIGGSLDASVVLYATPELANTLRILGNELSFGLITSSAIVSDYSNGVNVTQYAQAGMPGLKIFLEKAKGKKCLRCWHYRLDIDQYKNYSNICARCINNIVGPGEKRRFF
ncbi:isoleucine--tRNA ligase [Blochmannia endosymbiont of Camponotus modoc]|uniref:isoleucine--tRNA ligase n=1 Tax=Blochmannia endosymbiont of Camponotus modoc TaxID=2945587 RepID=UPI0020254EB9|nr:isoleucine--tRNA ligase [Blochmannia endosymbiont of Camponotus modoc]URJ29319.1 isoleucine--tRNA ligase [Blochmannia endosymbiont of Camponotus modoc]